ncbi:MAG: ATP-binding protein [Anaerolinea sp.]|nr:ATP-binding protein [Anaerolinea sp.]
MMADPISHEAPARKGQDLPVMLPGKLIGREATVRQVYAQLKDNKPALIFGASGVGKTALVATIASAYTELPGGVLWMHVDDTPFAELLVRVGRAYNIAELTTTDNPLALVGAAASTLTQNKPLIVFDGKPNTAATTEFITRVAERLPVLLTSDEEIQGKWTSFRLAKLEPDQAAMFYRQLADPATPYDGLNQLTAALDYLPFALAVAAGISHLKKQTPAQFLSALPPQPQGAGATPQLLALTAAFKSLSGALPGLLLVMGSTLRGEASAELVSMIANAPVEAIQGQMALLAQYRLLERFERYGSPYYRMHPITYLFAQSWLRGSGRLETLAAKFRDSVLAYTRKYSAQGRAGHDHLAAEMDNIVATAQRAADLGDRDVANALIVALTQAGDFINSRGYVYDLLALRRLATSSTGAFPAHTETIPAVTPTAAPVTPPLPALDEDEDELADSVALKNGDVLEDEPEAEIEEEAPKLVSVASTLSMFETDDTLDEEFIDDEDDDEENGFDDDDEFDEDEVDEDDEPLDELDEVEGDTAPDAPVDELTRLRNQVLAARQAGDRRRHADALSAVGGELVSQGKDTEAIPSYSEALTMYEAINDSSGMLAALEALADLTAKTDNSQATVLYASRGVRLAHQLQNDTSESRLLLLLGDAHQQLGESAEAIRAYSQALDLARGNDGMNEATVLYKLGYAQLDSGEPEEAIDTWEEALTLFRQNDQRADEGKVLGGLGTANGKLERWREAINFHTSALYIAREVKDRTEEREQLSLLGYASIQARELGQAVLRYRQALHLAYQSGSKDAIVSTTVDLARLLIESPRHLDVADMLIDAALQRDPNDRDLFRLQAMIDEKRVTVTAQQTPVSGTAQQYAANAYTLLEN